MSKVSAPDIRFAETRDAEVVAHLKRVDLFNDLVAEARRGPGVADVRVMMDCADGREVLGRVVFHLQRKLIAGT